MKSYKTRFSNLIPRREPLGAAIAAITLSFGAASALADEHAATSDQAPLHEQQEHATQTGEAAAQTDKPWAAQAGDAASDETGEQSDGAKAVAALAEQEASLETFTKALQESGIADGLTEGQQYTVFAPTNDAFESASGRSAEELLQPENRAELVELLRAHIVADDVDMDMAKEISEARTIDGGTVKLTVEDDKLQVGDASVVQSSLQEGMLRVYPIDTVLEPQPAEDRSATTASSDQESQESETDTEFSAFEGSERSAETDDQQ